MFCLTCDYPLDGLDSMQCPKCGRGFISEDMRTYRTKKVTNMRRNAAYFAASIPVGILAAAGSFITVMGGVAAIYGDDDGTLMSASICAIFAAPSMGLTVAALYYYERTRVIATALTIILMIAALLLVLGVRAANM